MLNRPLVLSLVPDVAPYPDGHEPQLSFGDWSLGSAIDHLKGASDGSSKAINHDERHLCGASPAMATSVSIASARYLPGA
jgi:hypothetical protein